MSSGQILLQRVFNALKLTEDFIRYLPESVLQMDIPHVPSNTIGGQIWCMVGARESYLRALKAGEWDGFSYSLKEQNKKDDILLKLNETDNDIRRFIQNEVLSDAHFKLLFELLEHEVQHHGQLIRFAYANKLSFPESWNRRYTV